METSPEPALPNRATLLTAIALACAIAALIGVRAFASPNLPIVGVATFGGTLAAWRGLGEARRAGRRGLVAVLSVLLGFLGTALAALVVLGVLVVLRTRA